MHRSGLEPPLLPRWKIFSPEPPPASELAKLFSWYEPGSVVRHAWASPGAYPLSRPCAADAGGALSRGVDGFVLDEVEYEVAVGVGKKPTPKVDGSADGGPGGGTGGGKGRGLPEDPAALKALLDETPGPWHGPHTPPPVNIGEPRAKGGKAGSRGGGKEGGKAGGNGGKASGGSGRKQEGGGADGGQGECAANGGPAASPTCAAGGGGGREGRQRAAGMLLHPSVLEGATSAMEVAALAGRNAAMLVADAVLGSSLISE